MARDYTKYSVAGIGENLNKRKLVAAVVADYVSKNNPTFKELQEAFPDSIQGNKGFIRRADDIQDEKRFDTKRPLLLKYKIQACVSNQWGKENVAAFIEHVKGLGYAVEEVSAAADGPTASNDAPKSSGAPGGTTPTSYQAPALEVSDDVRALINEAAPYEMDGILAQILGKEEESVTSLDFMPFLMEILCENRFCSVELSEDYFGRQWQIDFINDKMSDVLAEANYGTEGFGPVSEYQKVWSELLTEASKPAVAINYDCHMYIANCIDQAICPFENEEDMRALADKHYQLAAETADGMYELIDVIHACGTGENELTYRNDALLEECIRRGLDFADSFDDYRNLCFKDEHQLAKGNQFEAALAGCKKCMAADDFDVEFYADEIKEMNDGLERLGMATLEIPDYNIEPLRKMKLPEHLTPEWDLSWGSYASICLLNSPDLEEDEFTIHLSLATGQILGCKKENENAEREYRWFGGEALLYQYNQEEYASTAHIQLYDRSHLMLCDASWNGCIEDIDEGELPPELTEDRFNEIFNGKWFSALYHHIKQHLSYDGVSEEGSQPADAIESTHSEHGQEETCTAAFPEDYLDARKMPLPEHLRPDWDLNWGSYVSINLQNSPEMQTDNFTIMLSLGTHQILGAPIAWERQGDHRWFQDDALLYPDNLEDYQSTCSIWLYDADFEEICNVLMHGCLEDIDYGELPPGLSEDRFNEIFNGEWFSALYHHIKQNLHHAGLDD